MNLRRWLSLSVAGGLSLSLLSLAACDKPRTVGTAANPPSNSNSAIFDPGAPLYPAAPLPKVELPTTLTEPIVIPNAVVLLDERVQVPATVEAPIELIAVPLPEGAKYDPKDPNIVFHPRDTERRVPYRRLREDDIVRKDEIIARLDEQLIDLQKQANEALIKEHLRAKIESDKARQAYQEQYDVMQGIPSTPRFELLGLKATVARLQADVIQAEREKVKTEGDLRTATAQLSRYWVFSPINGRVTKILKSPREFAKAGDVILEIQGIDRVRVEGKMPLEYANLVKKGMKVLVEPARPLGPNPISTYHRQEVTSICVTANKDKDGQGRPMIVSGGLDATALVWDVTRTKVSHRLPHPTGVGVRSVCATGPATKVGYLVATGGDDGIVRLWDVNNPDKLPNSPMHSFDGKDERHNSGVIAAAFSPDGRYLATAAGRDVTIWDVSNRKKKYSLPAEHKDAVTTIKFTPQATLLTMSRDKSIRVWQIGENGGVTKSVIDHRSGLVDLLGVSSDGSRMLFDKDASRLDLVSLADERTLGTLQSPGGSRFSGFALFSNDDKLILTASGEADKRGELTVWEAPQAGGRGAERRRLLTPKAAPVTCAAFSPDATHRFVAVGTAEGGVHFWTAPTPEELGKATTGEVVAILPADARSVTVRVELNNPLDRPGEMLQDRSLATIIIDPSAPVTPPAGGPAVLNTVPAGGSAIRPASGTAPMGNPVIPAGGVVAPPMPPVIAPPKPSPPLPNPPPGKLPMVQVPNLPGQ